MAYDTSGEPVSIEGLPADTPPGTYHAVMRASDQGFVLVVRNPPGSGPDRSPVIPASKPDRVFALAGLSPDTQRLALRIIELSPALEEAVLELVGRAYADGESEHDL
jgi:hypothetical protein